MAATDGKKKALEIAMASIVKAHGDGAVMRLGEATHMQVDVIPTGSLALDIALGVGGIPRGRITEIYGPESSGKTTICQHVVAEAQKRGGVAAFIDMEHALDPSYAAKCGVNVDELIVSQPDTGEQAFDIAEQLIRSSAVDVVVIDSVAALVPKAEIEGEITDQQPGVQARLMSRACRRLSGIIKQTNTAVIFTNQLRQKIGVMFGNPETTTGGMALKFYASVRLDVRRIQAIKGGGEVTGSRTRVRVTKNKVAPPFREAEFDIMYNEGISKLGDMLDVAIAMNILEKRGTFILYEGTRIGQGRENAKAYLKEHPEVVERIEQAVRSNIAAGTAAKIAPLTKPEAGEDEGEEPELDV
ncbi:MAG: recombinase RecA [Anaerolineae bacterium]|nr:recombinase RecA [Thermoflexales bacterium]MDW8408742.1 recombinase RecA [Anaerolineae bacterium]